MGAASSPEPATAGTTCSLLQAEAGSLTLPQDPGLLLLQLHAGVGKVAATRQAPAVDIAGPFRLAHLPTGKCVYVEADLSESIGHMDACEDQASLFNLIQGDSEEFHLQSRTSGLCLSPKVAEGESFSTLDWVPECVTGGLRLVPSNGPGSFYLQDSSGHCLRIPGSPGGASGGASGGAAGAVDVEECAGPADAFQLVSDKGRTMDRERLRRQRELRLQRQRARLEQQALRRPAGQGGQGGQGLGEGDGELKSQAPHSSSFSLIGRKALQVGRKAGSRRQQSRCKAERSASWAQEKARSRPRGDSGACEATLYWRNASVGWQAALPEGSWPQHALLHCGAMMQEITEVRVGGAGCVATMYEDHFAGSSVEIREGTYTLEDLSSLGLEPRRVRSVQVRTSQRLPAVRQRNASASVLHINPSMIFSSTPLNRRKALVLRQG
eukprot:CAMPEP_0170602628 /NCGR_PEP_ID=MMETSP0224-20130122/18489_1 /TAXON_ID=285029 /ORGANISM="Togula jolla, Strain CCCM 725" /LENGTH=438 /DNA_ID=CAMNT_0010927473 /DNA_START=44 /DNA_END=1360 /DNA_ORIENTATION=-